MTRVPKLRRQKRTGCPDEGFIEMGGQRVYLGRWDDPGLPTRYARALSGERATPGDLTIVEMVAEFMAHARRYYRRPSGEETGAADAYYYALKPLEELYGELEVGEFGPRQRKVVQAHMIRAGNARTYANDRVGWIKRCFKWAVSEGLAPASVYQGLQAVAGLRAGYQDVRETEKVGPVPSEHIEAVKAFVRPEIADLIELQLATAMRSGKMLSMTRCQLDLSRDPWEFEPHQHKSKHRGRPRKIYIGPRGQAVLRKYLLAPESALLFRYFRDSYRRAVNKACKRLRIKPPWHPHQLRHSCASELRKKFGLETAKAILGHTELAMAEHYCEKDAARARDAMRKFG